MDIDLILKLLTLLVGFYMAWNIGANDVSNAISTSVGSKALTLKKAVIIAAIFEFCGAYFLGSKVSQTIQQGIVNPDVFTKDSLIFVLGMMGALLATGIWLNIASYFKLPVSTTHAIVGSVVGFGAIIGGMHAVHWMRVLAIVASWIVTPAISGLLSYFVFSLLQKKILYALNPIQATKKFIPFLVFFALLFFSYTIVSSRLTNLKFSFSFPISSISAIIVGTIAAIISIILLKKVKITSCPVIYHHPQHIVSLEKAKKYLQRTKFTTLGETQKRSSKILKEVDELIGDIKEKTDSHTSTNEYLQVEKMFGFLQIISVCLIAFAHGSNDVANAIGPVAAVMQTLKEHTVALGTTTPSWILLLGAVGIVIGLATWGWRVVETIGHKITQLTPTRGFSAEFGAALTILFSSKLGLPISTTHALVGSVLGVGLAKGLRALNLRTLRDIVLSWIVTIPICAVLAITVFYILKAIFY